MPLDSAKTLSELEKSELVEFFRNRIQYPALLKEWNDLIGEWNEQNQQKFDELIDEKRFKEETWKFRGHFYSYVLHEVSLKFIINSQHIEVLSEEIKNCFDSANLKVIEEYNKRIDKEKTFEKYQIAEFFAQHLSSFQLGSSTENWGNTVICKIIDDAKRDAPPHYRELYEIFLQSSDEKKRKLFLTSFFKGPTHYYQTSFRLYLDTNELVLRINDFFQYCEETEKTIDQQSEEYKKKYYAAKMEAITEINTWFKDSNVFRNGMIQKIYQGEITLKQMLNLCSRLQNEALELAEKDKEKIEAANEIISPSQYIKDYFEREEDSLGFTSLLLKKDQDENSFFSLAAQYCDKETFNGLISETIYNVGVSRYLKIFENENNNTKEKLIEGLIAVLHDNTIAGDRRKMRELSEAKFSALVSCLAFCPEYKEKIIDIVIKELSGDTKYPINLVGLIDFFDRELRKEDGDKEIIKNLLKFFVIIINEKPEWADGLVVRLLKFNYSSKVTALNGKPIMLNAKAHGSVRKDLALDDLDFLKLIIATGNEELFSELENITNKKIADKLFSHSTRGKYNGPIGFNALHTAAHYHPKYLSRIWVLLSSKEKIALAEQYAYIPLDDAGEAKSYTPLHLAAMTKEGAAQIPAILASLGFDKTYGTLQQPLYLITPPKPRAIEHDEPGKNYHDYYNPYEKDVVPDRERYEKINTLFGLLVLNEPEQLRPILRTLRSSARDLIRHKSISNPHIQQEIAIINADVKELSMIHKTYQIKDELGYYLSETISAHLIYYFSPRNYELLVAGLDELGKEDTLKTSCESMTENITSNLIQNLPESFTNTKEIYRKIIKEVILFLMNPKVTDQKFVEGMTSLIPVLFNNTLIEKGPDVFYDALSKVLAERQFRHDQIERKVTSSVDPERAVNVLFNSIKQALLNEASLNKQTYSLLHPCGAAYSLVKERTKPESGYDAKDVEEWFIKLVVAKEKGDKTEMGNLVSHFKRPTKTLKFSMTDKDEAFFKATMERFCAADDKQMKKFWSELEQEQQQQKKLANAKQSSSLLNSLMVMHPDQVMLDEDNNPGVIAYTLIKERMSEKGYDKTTVQNWFINLVIAKRDGKVKDLESLMQHHNRPTKAFLFSKLDPKEGGFKTAMQNFCDASPAQMKAFWHFMEEMKAEEDVAITKFSESSLLDELVKYKPQEGHSGRFEKEDKRSPAENKDGLTDLNL